jgi:radical SAM superfamily enzyme YgiQ (UPF0313 family)
MEHLGIMSIVSYARSRGVDAVCVNGIVSNHASLDETWRVMVEKVRRHGQPTLVGFSNINSFWEVLELAERSRNFWEGIPIVLGNVMATLNYDHILRTYDCIDFIVIGDGEHAIVELSEVLANEATVENIRSLAWRDETGKVRSTPPSMVDLDTLPPPARDELPSVLGHGFSAAVYSTRGCPYRCTFCGTGAMSGLLGRDSYRTRSTESVVDEIEYLVYDFGIDFVSITDDLFVSKHPSTQARAAQFGNEILRRRLDIRFMIDVRLDSVTDLAIFRQLHRAGLRRVFVGLETGSYDQLVSYRKRLVHPGEDVVAKITALQEIGIEIVPGIIMFHPAVQPSELRETIKLLRAVEYKAPRKFLNRVTAYPGTPLYQDYATNGLLTSEWPVGKWEFADPEARCFYDDLVRHIELNPAITFDEAEHFFLDRIDKWEDIVTARSHFPPEGHPHQPWPANGRRADTKAQ